jgi:hypothetical protein
MPIVDGAVYPQPRTVILGIDMLPVDMLEVLANYYTDRRFENRSSWLSGEREMYERIYMEFLSQRSTKELRMMIGPLIDKFPKGYQLCL